MVNVFFITDYCCVLVHVLLELVFETKVWTANKHSIQNNAGCYKPLATKKSYLNSIYSF